MKLTKNQIIIIKYFVIYTILLILVIWTIAPLFWMITTSLKETNEIYGDSITIWPKKLTFENYFTIFNETPFLVYFKNSVIVAILTTFFSIIFSSLGAYALSRFNFPGKKIFARCLVYSYLMPHSMLFIPILAIVIFFNLENTLNGLVLVYLGFTIPFCTWLLMGYFLSFPTEIEDAALVDGCSRLGVLIRIVLPITAPAIAVVAFFSFTLSWNEYIYASVIVSDLEVSTIPKGIPNFVIEDVFFWGPMMASTLLSSIPPLIVYFVFQRYIVSGLTLGSIKG